LRKELRSLCVAGADPHAHILQFDLDEAARVVLRYPSVVGRLALIPVFEIAASRWRDDRVHFKYKRTLSMSGSDGDRAALRRRRGSWSLDEKRRIVDVLSRIAAHPAYRLDELLPWNWRPPAQRASTLAA
jgi:hypothetical protein